MSSVALKSNVDGQLLKSPDGNVLRENYDFGRCFRPVTRNFYLCTKDNLGLSKSSLTIMFFYNKDLAFDDYHPAYCLIDTNSKLHCGLLVNGYNISIGDFPTNANATNELIGVANNNPIQNTGRHFFKCGISTDPINNFSIQNDKVKESRTFNFPDDIDHLQFGFSNQGSSYSAGQNLTVIYNRVVSQQEVDYMLNNLSGSDVLKRTGLVGYYTMQIAEILDFSAGQDGSDMRVGVRDSSGLNNHLYFAGLPVGSLASQLAYANTNGFSTQFV